MISRRRIISRSQNELNFAYETEEDVWFCQSSLYQDHITEILRKWDQIDDEIWCKVICMERNRRIAKAYSRVPVLTINGSDDGFNGYKIGLNEFDNPMRDRWAKQVKSRIGKGVQLKMDDTGNIFIKRMSDCDVFIRGWNSENNSLSKDIIDLGGELEFEKSVKLFDMKKFQASVSRELRSVYPDRKRLKSQCICAIAFVQDSSDLLDLCSWVLLVNIVALDILKSQFPAILEDRDELSNSSSQIPFSRLSAPKFTSVFNPSIDNINVPSPRDVAHRHRLIADEDPCSVPLPTPPPTSSHLRSNQYDRMKRDSKSTKNNESSKTTTTTTTSDPKPPELPPRDVPNTKIGKHRNFHRTLKSLVKSSGKNGKLTTTGKDDRKRQEIAYEDPYYCGLQARVPNFTQAPEPKSLKVASSKIIEHKIPSPSSNNGQIRKSHSSGYLNSWFSQQHTNFFPTRKINNKCNSNPYYDSSLDSDLQGHSSGSGYEVYTPYGLNIRSELTDSTSATLLNFIPSSTDNSKTRRMSYHGNRYVSSWDI